MKFALALLLFIQAKVVIPDTPPAAYLFPAEIKVQLRDLQYQGDQLEIQKQKKLMEIEKLTEQQNALVDQMKGIAFDFAQAKKIDLNQYELDAVQMKFAKKK